MRTEHIHKEAMESKEKARPAQKKQQQTRKARATTENQ